jgi:Arc/MetJ-type ribon-helix-helix transcriptional regulator
MAYQFPPEVEHLFRERMASGRYATADELLKEAILALAEREEDLVAVRESLAEFHAGDAGADLAVAFDGLRRRQATNPNQ